MKKNPENPQITIKSAFMTELSSHKIEYQKSSSLPGSVVFETLQHLVELGNI